MPFFEDTTCPFCGARFQPGASACPACDLPLLGEDGSRPPERESTPFDGASLFDDAFPDEEFLPERKFDPPLAIEAPSRVALYVFADGSWVVENFRNESAAVKLDGKPLTIEPRNWMWHWQ